MLSEPFRCSVRYNLKLEGVVLWLVVYNCEVDESRYIFIRDRRKCRNTDLYCNILCIDILNIQKQCIHFDFDFFEFEWIH